VHDLHPFLREEIVKRGAARCGLTWHYCRPPVIDLKYKMDCRSVPKSALCRRHDQKRTIRIGSPVTAGRT
jgi:hypothetical protein